MNYIFLVLLGVTTALPQGIPIEQSADALPNIEAFPKISSTLEPQLNGFDDDFVTKRPWNPFSSSKLRREASDVESPLGEDLKSAETGHYRYYPYRYYGYGTYYPYYRYGYPYYRYAPYGHYYGGYWG
ncbi:uncharacterized protein LOC136042215 [Artemia franciscana]|uniref:uncharacterized protein LOC136042215 n=1 Tax=Artemia franciscana TaxID=6661 RepID=UPI0032DB8A6C